MTHKDIDVTVPPDVTLEVVGLLPGPTGPQGPQGPVGAGVTVKGGSLIAALTFVCSR